jgi:hypothetical protein
MTTIDERPMTSLHSKSKVWAPRVLALGVMLAGAPASALPGDLATKYQVDDENPVKSVPSPEQRDADPIEFGYFIQDLIARAEGAFQKKEWERSVKYYEALARTIPDAAVSYSRLCVGYAELGKVEIAAANCGRAVQLSGAKVLDHLRFVGLTLKKPTFTAKDAEDAEASLAHLRAHVASKAPPKVLRADSSAAPSVSTERSKEEIKREFLALRERRALEDLGAREPEPKNDGALATEVEVFACKVGIRLRDAARLDRCLAALKEQKTNPALLLPFEWASALIRKDELQATALIERAKSHGLPASAIQAMQAEQENTFAPAGILGLFKRAPMVPVLSLVGLLAVAGIGWFGVKRWKRRTGSAASV